MPAPLIGGALSEAFVWRLSDVWRLSVAYIGPMSRTGRPRKTRIGTEIAHVTRDSDTTARSKGQRSRSPGRFTHRDVYTSCSCSGGRGNVLAVGNCCYVAICSAAQGASAPTGGGEGREHIVAAARLQLVWCEVDAVLWTRWVCPDGGILSSGTLSGHRPDHSCSTLRLYAWHAVA